MSDRTTIASKDDLGRQDSSAASGPERSVRGCGEELGIEPMEKSANSRYLLQSRCLANRCHFLGADKLREVEAANVGRDHDVGRADSEGVEVVVLHQQAAEDRLHDRGLAAGARLVVRNVAELFL